MIPDRSGVFKKLLQRDRTSHVWGPLGDPPILIEARSSEEQLCMEIDQTDGYRRQLFIVIGLQGQQVLQELFQLRRL